MRSLLRTLTRLSAAVLLLTGGALAASPADAIVGGSQADEGEFPFMASIQSKGQDGTSGHFCGGSVIGTRWVLTAAHCLVDTAPGEIQVGVGRTDIDDLSTGQTLAVDRIVVHPDYAETGTFDAALVHVTADIAAPSIALTAVGEDGLEADGAPLTVAGWGTEFFGSPVIPSGLKSVDVEAVADASCTTNAMMGFQPDSELCAEALGGDSCQGDSGGPLFGTVAGRVTQVGIVSYGLGCATPAFPGVYGEVNNASIRGFISATTGI
ncbi:MAG TPA: serine protease [Nocardioides sp.]|nr:serine protease [Nocardioides sp.]